MNIVFQCINKVIDFIKKYTISILTRIIVIFKLLAPNKRVIARKIENEYIILITSQAPDKGLSSLVSDTNKLLRYVHKPRTKVLQQECTISFSTTESKQSVEQQVSDLLEPLIEADEKES